MNHEVFEFDARLGIHIPQLQKEWECYSEAERSSILEQWEWIRGRIPDRIMELEAEINRKQEHLNQEEHFPTSCRLNLEIADLASTIHDLNIWYRTNQELHPVRLHG